mgnify:CR=1 FL=1
MIVKHFIEEKILLFEIIEEIIKTSNRYDIIGLKYTITSKIEYTFITFDEILYM